MKLHFYGGARVVTGSNYLIEVGQTKLLVDCGLFQGPPEVNELNQLAFPYDPKTINYVFVTHSHLDHCGRLGQLVKNGFKGQIFCTLPTKDLMAVALEDAVKLMSEDYKDKGLEPLYGQQDLQTMLGLIKTQEYNQPIKLNKNIEFILRDAGHILGSSMIELFLNEGTKKVKIVFTGDLGNPPTPLLNPTYQITDTDYLLIDSAYGDRNHESKEQRRELLKQAFLDAINRKAVLMIPSFALERTQELLYELNGFVENKLIPPVPIFIDSPLAIKITEVYKKHQNYFNKKTRYIIASGDNIFAFPGLKFTSTANESKRINKVPTPKVIIAGSGMSTGGRILFHEKLYLSDPNNLFLVIGFQVEGTLGRKILEGIPLVHIMGEDIKNKAESRAIGGYSAHADQRQILKFIKNIKKPIKMVFPVQGEKRPAEVLRKLITSKLGIVAELPKYEQVVEL
ncbi:MAG: MBL fold metallo-hydrolase [Candidatus Parcubacteria bacterium]|nr:MBL fold metallo-hydrolase [Candidatus Parcubacteria bacterium]